MKTSGEPLLPRAEITDGDDGSVVLRVEKDPTVTEVLLPELVLCGNTLRALGQIELTGSKLERLPLSRTFAPAQFGELVFELGVFVLEISDGGREVFDLGEAGFDFGEGGGEFGELIFGRGRCGGGWEG